MENSEVFGLFILVSLLVGICIASIPLFVGLGSIIANYWTRDRYNFEWGDWVFRKMYFDVYNEDCAVLNGIIFMGYVFGPPLLSILYYNGILFEGIIVIVGLLSLVFLPRILIDISHSIKMNHKTGNAERIDKLEAEIEKLRSRR